jgi:Gpi18-like mannosyltransferase
MSEPSIRDASGAAALPAQPAPSGPAGRWRCAAGALIERHGGWIGLVLVLAAGAAARMILSLRDGHLYDVDLFLRWMRSLNEHGLGGFYAAEPGCNYPPLYLLVLRGLGWLLDRWGPGLSDTSWLRAWLRGPACLADGLIALLLYVECRRIWGRRAATAAAALFFLNPVALYNSAYWGQVDSIHSAFVLAALVALNRSRPGWSGAAIAVAVLQKLQAVAFVPLILLDAYRWKRWSGLGRCAAGALVAAVIVLGPFAGAGVLAPALRQGYVRVVGQYNKLSSYAFNVWQLGGRPDMPDGSVPLAVVRAAARGEVSVAEGAHWLLYLNWRRLGILFFALATAGILAVYSLRSGEPARALAAGLIGLAFFLFLTEMHERYAFPVLAVLPIWALGGAWRERAYLLLSAAMLLNLTDVQPVKEIAGEISGLHLVVFGLFVGALLLPLTSASGARTAGEDRAADSCPPPPASAVVAWFRRVTLACLAVFAVAAGVVAWWIAAAAPPAGDDVLYLSDVPPRIKTQGYGSLGKDCSVEGGVIHLGDQYYLRGLGTHAPANVVYLIPPGYRTFRALAGVNRQFNGRVRVEVHLDGKPAFSSDPLTAADPPVDIRLPLEGARRLKLSVSPLEDKKGDHVDWALARLEK